MPTSTTKSSAPDAAASQLALSSGEVEGSLEWLRVELAATRDAARQARLLTDIADAEERLADEAGAVRDLIAAHQADPTFREPLERLATFIDNNSSFNSIQAVFDSLVEISSSPDERVRALLRRALHQSERLGDLSAALGSVREAAFIEGAAPAEQASAFLALEVLAGRTGDAGARELALAERVGFASDPTWRTLLLVDQARLVAAAGDVDTALELIEQAKAQNSRATWAALVLEDELLRAHPGIEEMGQATARVEHRARTLEEMATVVRRAMTDAVWGDALGVPRWVREPGRAVDLWLTAATIHRDLGRVDVASAALGSAQMVIETMVEPEKSVAESMVAHARIRLADLAGDPALAAELAARALGREADGPTAAGLAVRVAEQAAAKGNRIDALAALDEALRQRR